MIACSFPGKIGDALYSLPTVRQISKIYNTKIDFYTSTYCRGLKNLIEYQPYINKCIVSENYQIKRYDMGIQPWLMPINTTGYDKVFHLGYKTVPNTSLHHFIANSVGIRIPGDISYSYPEYKTLDEPYIVLAPHNDARYLKIFSELIETIPIKVVIVGSKDEYIGKGIDKTGLDFLDVLVWLSKASGFIGMSSNFVLAEGFDYPKIVPHDGHTFDMRHLIYDNTHFYPINPDVNELRRLLRIMNTLSKTLNPQDYKTLGGYAQHFLNIIDHFRHVGMNLYRYEHEHRKWEYGMVYKALDTIRAKDVLDVGGGGSLLAPAMGWLGINVHQVDPGAVGGWIEEQSRAVGKELTFEQEDFMSYKSTKKYDAVTCVSVIEHVPNDIQFFRKLLNYVKDGGLLCITTDFHPSGTQIVSGHIKAYNKESLMELAEIAKKKGFEFFGGEPDYDYFGEHVNGCDFASLIMIKKGK